MFSVFQSLTMSEFPGESRPAGHLSVRWKKAAPRRGVRRLQTRRDREGEHVSHSDPLPATASVLKQLLTFQGK